MTSANDPSSGALTPRIAVIGAGISGASCAHGLRQAGLEVTVFDKSNGVGGRMATRTAQWQDAAGNTQSVCFDHGSPWFTARRPRFRAAVLRAEAAGFVLPWRQRVHAAWPAPELRAGFVGVPGMPGMARHLLADVPQALGHAVQRLHRTETEWQLVLADGSKAGPFSQVVLALPPPQAAALLAGHHDAWADTLDATRMAPCWTLMALTDDVHWPWDAAEPARGPLMRVLRNDRAPGRHVPPGCAMWVAHARADWSAEHLEDDPAAVSAALREALAALMPGEAAPPVWHHAALHRWRYGYAAQASAAPDQYLWDAGLGLAVCGDALGGGGTVEAAWSSGDELADELAAFHDGAAAAHPVAVAAPLPRKATIAAPPRRSPRVRAPQSDKAMARP